MSTKNTPTRPARLYEISPIFETDATDTLCSCADGLDALAEIWTVYSRDNLGTNAQNGLAFLLMALAGTIRTAALHPDLVEKATIDVPAGPGSDFRLDVTGVHTELSPEAARVARDWLDLAPEAQAAVVAEIRTLAAAEAAETV